MRSAAAAPPRSRPHPVPSSRLRGRSHCPAAPVHRSAGFSAASFPRCRPYIPPWPAAPEALSAPSSCQCRAAGLNCRISSSLPLSAAGASASQARSALRSPSRSRSAAASAAPAACSARSRGSRSPPPSGILAPALHAVRRRSPSRISGRCIPAYTASCPRPQSSCSAAARSRLQRRSRRFSPPSPPCRRSLPPRCSSACIRSRVDPFHPACTALHTARTGSTGCSPCPPRRSSCSSGSRSTMPHPCRRPQPLAAYILHSPCPCCSSARRCRSFSARFRRCSWWSALRP